ncbi:MAG: hypothetical protein WHV66_01530 [Anaerolineales bacterium]|jgi:hypothetical protein
MDAIFAILVLGAVIFFGALISAGNERQRKAIDGIREQAAQWAMQDLRLKREHLARDVKVDDPVAWLNQVVEKVYGGNLNLTVTEIFDEPQTLVCAATDSRRVILSLASPGDVQTLKRAKKNKLSRLGNAHPLQTVPAGQAVELSLLNSGVCFDLELQMAWAQMTGKQIHADHVWLYL